MRLANTCTTSYKYVNGFHLFWNFTRLTFYIAPCSFMHIIKNVSLLGIETSDSIICVIIICTQVFQVWRCDCEIYIVPCISFTNTVTLFNVFTMVKRILVFLLIMWVYIIIHFIILKLSKGWYFPLSRISSLNI